MAKLRVHELAKRLNVSSRDILAELTKLGIEAKTHASSIEDEVAQKLTRIFVETKAEELAPKKKERISRPGFPEKKVPKEKEIKEEIKVEKVPVKPQPEPESPVIVAEEEEIKLPDRFRREIEAEKFIKLKARPGMQKAFTNIKRVDIARKWHESHLPHKRYDKKLQPETGETKVATIPTQPRRRVLKFQEGTTVREFAELIGQKLSEVIKKFMGLGLMPTINQPVDQDAAQIVAESFGVKIEPIHVEGEEPLLEEEVDASKLKPRPPIVTIMGHVDHGKTTLLDAIRQTKIAEMEAGGITQRIGAYKVGLKEREIVFLDTPGHEAFTMMRARGAKVTDIVVLVVAADDGVMPQTVEAINHAKAANVPIVVAINKIDKPEADVMKVKNELAQHGIIPEEWGGQNIFVEISAKQRRGIEHLLEMILLQAEVMELKADYHRPARGTIIEARLDRSRGPVATVIVNSGTLKVGDVFLAGTLAGRVRALIDDSSRRVESAGPSTPVEVIGFPDIPHAGDIFVIMDDERKARQIATSRQERQRSSETVKIRRLTLDDLYEKIKEEGIKELNIIIKADTQGSVEAVRDALEGLSHPQVKVKVIHSAVGGINESDVMLATASNAVIIGFNTRPDTKAHTLAEMEGVDIRHYNVIYDVIEAVKKALEGLLEPTITERILGRAEVRQLFHISKVGTVAGCYVLDGVITRASSGIRVLRDNIVIYDSKIASLKRFKDDVREVQAGYECGILIENFNDVKVGDILEDYLVEEVAVRLK